MGSEFVASGSSKGRLPSVSIAIPALNEAAHIETVVSTFLATKYPNLIEVFVVDGGSTDGTQEAVKRLSEKDPRVKLVRNPQRIQAAGLNLILNEAVGDIFLRADAHCEYANDYVARCVEALLETGAVNVGGAQRFAAETAFQAGVALASRSILGSGRARYRDPRYDGYVEAVYLGCFWRHALADVSGYSLKLTNEDAELNLRLLEAFAEQKRTQVPDSERAPTAMGKLPPVLYTSSRIKVWYYPRKTWWQLSKQYFNYGRGRSQTVRAHPGKSPLRGKLPFLFITFAALIFLGDLLMFSRGLHAAELVLLALALPFLEGFRTALSHRKSFAREFWRGRAEDLPALVYRALLCGLVLLTQPLAHFAGFGYQSVLDTVDAVTSREALP